MLAKIGKINCSTLTTFFPGKGQGNAVSGVFMGRDGKISQNQIIKYKGIISGRRVLAVLVYPDNPVVLIVVICIITALAA
ncbi:hypothetical protein PsAD46_01346 [Pseudovibrio sp. Ad46]|nr:hypothetical protein PsAD46_01346 [Pseudovibrio sp. Ad46]